MDVMCSVPVSLLAWFIVNH